MGCKSEVMGFGSNVKLQTSLSAFVLSTEELLMLPLAPLESLDRRAAYVRAVARYQLVKAAHVTF